ncbi:Bro-N domain-containing protein [Microbulbifer sp. 2304DJ12-6]|uniref:BRO-N domain-containing protein n=1 Tax=Microbulbifer sp. 2304DJ12-6 TaxID=3233340 RepID=UPI0039B07ADF
MSNIIPFNFNNRGVRVIESETGEPWFILKDVCEVLELSNPRAVAQRLDDDELRKFDLRGQAGEVHIINESGLYTVVLRSDKPTAKPFKRWVTHEVYQREPRYKYRLRYEFLRSDPPLQELQQLVQFFEDHYGRWDSFYFDDPYDGVRRRVRFFRDNLDVERFLVQLWELKSLELISVK